jgi:hypothetical protein
MLRPLLRFIGDVVGRVVGLGTSVRHVHAVRSARA